MGWGRYTLFPEFSGEMLSSLTRLTLGCILHLLLPRGQSRYDCHCPPMNLLGPRSSYFCHFYGVLGIIWNKPPTLGEEKSHAWQSLSKKWKGGRVSPRPEGDRLRAQVGLEERRLDRHLGDQWNPSRVLVLNTFVEMCQKGWRMSALTSVVTWWIFLGVWRDNCIPR